ncbi:MAG TPA: septal ring lytic transglycosylase RlpA family protein [Chromatiaceae bacterium]|jgi:rare lipoprotein A|nr:MAG: septal ring lytic transglycosylase RlpA family protein [Thiohalocapsa sp. PB-PSB1]HBG97010.1 septal ring lytic transglycosylase RlpA family protein [Chromatiaceae bacterium]HCS92577.1 septal ring lytic transglycosylase RlpA family protein [Chromatiaceae bacterium]
MQQPLPSLGLAPLPGALLAILILLLCGCGNAPKQIETGSIDGPPNAVPRVEPKARFGNMKSYVVYGKTYYPKQSSRGHVERGVASWYGKKFHGRKTSSGERYDMYQMTAAHKTLPLPTYALVNNLENGRSVVVKVNDRGPFIGNRIIDLSYAAAKKLGLDKQGTGRVEVISIDPRDHDGKVPKLHRVAAQRQGSRSRPSWPTSRSVNLASDARIADSAGGRSHLENRPAITSAQPFKPAPKPAIAQASATTSSAESPLYLQVGAFGTRNNAEQLRRRLKSLLQSPISIRKPDKDSKSAMPSLYRVRVGPVASRADADAIAHKLTSLGIARPLMIDN